MIYVLVTLVTVFVIYSTYVPVYEVPVNHLYSSQILTNIYRIKYFINTLNFKLLLLSLVVLHTITYYWSLRITYYRVCFVIFFGYFIIYYSVFITVFIDAHSAYSLFSIQTSAVYILQCSQEQLRPTKWVENIHAG
jgi:hypothetical protein